MDKENDKLFGIDIVELYDYSLDKAYDFILNNTDYLKDAPIEEVEDIEFSYYKDILILLKNGVLLFNGKERLENIKTLGFMSGISIFAFSNDNIITCLTGEWETVKFLNNDNYKYKKIIITQLVIVALTYGKEVKVFGTLVDGIVDYNRYIEIDDIGYVAKSKDIVVIKNDKVYSLFLENDYSNKTPNVILEGKLEDVIILNSIEKK